MRRFLCVLLLVCASCSQPPVNVPINQGASARNTERAGLHMLQPRILHTATRLKDGRVLICGGEAWVLAGDPNAKMTGAGPHPFDNVWNTCELFTLHVGFAQTGEMHFPRATHGAVRLKDGRVLIVGGARPPGVSWPDNKLDAEIYDPNTGAFTQTTKAIVGLPAERHYTWTSWYRIAVLDDGRVLIISNFGVQNSRMQAKLFDPQTGTLSSAGKMVDDERVNFGMTKLRDGRVLLSGGCEHLACNHSLNTAEIYDPKTGKFSATGEMHYARQLHLPPVLPDGTVLIWRGASDTDKSNSTEIYDPSTGQFVTGPDLPKTEFELNQLLDTGLILRVGRLSDKFGDPSIVPEAVLWDPRTRHSMAAAAPIFTRRQPRCVWLADKRLLITGGTAPDTGYVRSEAEIYDPKTGMFSSK